MARITVLDSGVGGLSVLRPIQERLPKIPVDYIMDDAAFPYGAWDEEGLRAHLLDLLGRVLCRAAPRLVVIACNTATTLAIHALRDRFPDTPFVGTVPAIKSAAAQTVSGMVSVLATPGTVRREYTQDLIDTFARGVRVNLVACPNLAAMAEAELLGAPIPDRELRAEIAPAFVERDGARTDVVVLGCTHYPFLEARMRRLSPWPVTWIDASDAIAARAAALLEAEGNPAEQAEGQGSRAFLTSGPPTDAVAGVLKGYGLSPQPMAQLSS